MSTVLHVTKRKDYMVLVSDKRSVGYFRKYSMTWLSKYVYFSPYFLGFLLFKSVHTFSFPPHLHLHINKHIPSKLLNLYTLTLSLSYYKQEPPAQQEYNPSFSFSYYLLNIDGEFTLTRGFMHTYLFCHNHYVCSILRISIFIFSY